MLLFNQNIPLAMKPFSLIIILFLLGQSMYAQIVNIEDRRTTFTDSVGWYENLDVGFSFSQNKKSVSTLHGSFQIEVHQKKRSFLSISQFTFVKAGGERFVNQGFQHLRFTRELSSKFSLESFGQIQYNQLIFIKLRALAGGGLRFHLVDKKKEKVNFGLSTMYEYDEEQGDVSRDDIRMSTYFSAAIRMGENAIISSTSYFQPLINKMADYRLSTETQLRVTLLGNVAFINTFSLTYDSRAPEEEVNTSYNLTSGISYVF